MRDLLASTTVSQQSDGVVGTLLSEIQVVLSKLRLIGGPVTQLLVQLERLQDGILCSLTNERWTRQRPVGIYADFGVGQRLALQYTRCTRRRHLVGTAGDPESLKRGEGPVGLYRKCT